MDIDKLEAGRELDALVAERVMGWKIAREGHPLYCGYPEKDFGWPPSRDSRNPWPITPYSTSISAAWEVVEKLKFIAGTHIGAMQIFLYTTGNYEVNFYIKNQLSSAEAPTAPLAICRAALKAVIQDE